jgi:hypothetical protein
VLLLLRFIERVRPAGPGSQFWVSGAVRSTNTSWGWKADGPLATRASTCTTTGRDGVPGDTAPVTDTVRTYAVSTAPEARATEGQSVYVTVGSTWTCRTVSSAPEVLAGITTSTTTECSKCWIPGGSVHATPTPRG